MPDAQPVQQVPEALPLFVDLDGSLLRSDSLYESAFATLRRHPQSVLRMPLWLLRGRARLKQELADRACLDATSLPYDSAVLDYLHEQRNSGRRLYLATAADRRIANAVAAHLAIFDGVIASDGKDNRKGSAKLQAIRALAPAGFAYLGNDRADLPIWRAATAAVVVNARPSVLRAAGRLTTVERVIGGASLPLAALARAMRPHQWVKNLLIFVPLLTAFQFDRAGPVLAALLAFVSFCCCASATYLANDLLDLQADRQHPRKRMRPFAAGTVGIPTGATAAVLLAAAGLLVAAWQSAALAASAAVYIAATSAYSLVLKRYVLIDVVMLALLYTLRILAGAVAIAVPVSEWLLAFALFLFLSLALVKRCSELVALQALAEDDARGRDYHAADLRVLWPLGIGAGLCSVLVFALFVNAPEVRLRYGAPALLWLVALALVYWLARMWLKTSRGEMTDDPIVFAFRDFGSRVVVVAMIVITLAAHSLHLP